MPVPEKQLEYAKKYHNKFDDIKIRVPGGKREEYKQYAKSIGTSLNKLVIDLLEKEINR